MSSLFTAANQFPIMQLPVKLNGCPTNQLLASRPPEFIVWCLGSIEMPDEATDRSRQVRRLRRGKVICSGSGDLGLRVR